MGVARSRFRSVRYDLTAAIEVARLAESAGGTIAPDLLAPTLGYSGTDDGAYLNRVANARLFGVVSGHGSRLELTERGRQILAGVEPGSSIARREAFLAVPLFRAVADATESRAGALPDDLARWLVDEFGEHEGKAHLVADQLIASAGQARLIRRRDDGNIQFTNLVTDFTSVDNPPSIVRIPQLGFLRGTRSSSGRTSPWRNTDFGSMRDRHRCPATSGMAPSRRRRLAAAAVLVVVAVPIALVAGGSTSRPAAGHTPGSVHRSATVRPAPGPLRAECHHRQRELRLLVRHHQHPRLPHRADDDESTTTCHQVKVPVPTGTAPGTARFSPIPTAGRHGGSIRGWIGWVLERRCGIPTGQPDPGRRHPRERITAAWSQMGDGDGLQRRTGDGCEP